MYLNYLSVTLYLSIFYLMNFLVGYLLLNFRKINIFLKMPFGVKLPIYISLGLISSSVIKYFVGCIFLHPIISILVPSIALLLILIVRKRKIKEDSLFSKSCFDKTSMLFMFLFLFVFVFFVFVAGTLQWPPWGDVKYHGAQTSLMLLHHKTLITWEPIVSSGQPSFIGYSLGFHSDVAYMSSLFNVYPGEAVFLLATSICILIPLVLSSLTYFLTRSKLFSVITFLSIFLYNPHHHHWIFGNYYNGPYPNYFGLLTVFTFCVLISMHELGKDELDSLQNAFILFLVNLNLIVTYPPYWPYVLITCIFLQRRQIRKAITWLFSTKTGIGVGGFFSLSSLVLYIFFKDFLNYYPYQALRGFFGALHTPFPYFTINFLHDNLIGVSITIALIISMFFMFRKTLLGVSVLYIIVFFLFLLGVLGVKGLTMLGSYRAIMISAGLSWVLIPAMFKHVSSHISNMAEMITLKFKKLKTTLHLRTLYNIVLLTSIFCLTVYGVYPSLETQLSLEPASYFSFRKERGLGFEDDFKALEFINNNVPSSDLILNDMSPTSSWVNSFSIKNLTFFWVANRPIEEYEELRMAWEKIDDAIFLKGVISKYQVRYIFVTSDLYNYEYAGWGGEQRPIKKDNYSKILDQYSFLNPVFKSGNTRVYETFLRMDGELVSWLEDFTNVSKWTCTTLEFSEKASDAHVYFQQNEGILSCVMNSTAESFGIILSHIFEEPLSLHDYDQLEFRVKTNEDGRLMLYLANETHIDYEKPLVYCIPQDWRTQSCNILLDMAPGSYYDRIWRIDVLTSGKEKSVILDLDWIDIYGYHYRASPQMSVYPVHQTSFSLDQIQHDPNEINYDVDFAGALSFDGVDDYVYSYCEVPNTWTIEFRLKSHTATFGRYDPIIFYEDGKNFFFIAIYGGSEFFKWRLTCRINGTDVFDDYNVPFAGATDLTSLNHFAATMNGTTVKFYHNGVLVKSVNTAWDGTIPSSNLYIGKGLLKNTYTNGIFTEVRIYNRSLTQAELNKNMKVPLDPVKDGLILWFPFGEVTADILHDLSGQERHGTIHGATWVERREFDRVIINLRVFDARTAVGDEALVFYDAFYEYDHKPFYGSVRLNDAVFSQNYVGNRTYNVTEIFDGKYNLTDFEANDVNVVFDKINIHLSVVPDSGGIYGPFSMPIVDIEAFYAYDNMPFDGIVTLNNSVITPLTPSGEYRYTVSSVVDGRYGITVFDSNTVTTKFTNPRSIIDNIMVTTLIALTSFFACVTVILVKRVGKTNVS